MKHFPFIKSKTELPHERYRACEAVSRPRNAIEAYRGGGGGENKRPSDWIARSSTRKRFSAAIDSGGWRRTTTTGVGKVGGGRLNFAWTEGFPRESLEWRPQQKFHSRGAVDNRVERKKQREREREREEQDLALNADVANFLPCSRKLLLNYCPLSPRFALPSSPENANQRDSVTFRGVSRDSAVVTRLKDFICTVFRSEFRTREILWYVSWRSWVVQFQFRKTISSH